MKWAGKTHGIAITVSLVLKKRFNSKCMVYTSPSHWSYLKNMVRYWLDGAIITTCQNSLAPHKQVWNEGGFV